MSLKGAIKQREDSIEEYKRILLMETNQLRIADIESKINFCQEEIELLQSNKPLFGKPKPLPQNTKIYEQDPEKKGEQKVTVITNSSSTSDKTEKVIVSENKIGNSLRDSLKQKVANATENSLRAKIMAAKAAKAKNNS